MRRFYLSNVSQIWPIARQEPLLDEAYPEWRKGPVYRDILSVRDLAHGAPLPERDEFLLRKSGRPESDGEIVVATLLAIARTQTELMLVLLRVAERHEKLRTIAEDMLIDPGTANLDEINREFHNAARRFSAKGVPGGKASAAKRAAASDAKIEYIRPLWPLLEPTITAIEREYNIARATIEARLGKRRVAQTKYAEDLRKQVHALKVAEANRNRRKNTDV